MMDHNESGNVVFLILLAVVLIGALSAAVMSSGNSESANIDDETMAIRVSEAQRHASELERAVSYILNNGYSESAIRFAHPEAPAEYGDLSTDTDLGDQVFHREGGGATYREPPQDVQTSVGGVWEFYGGTHLPGVGSDRADLIAVLPNVTQAFCDRVNELNGQTNPEDDGTIGASGGNPGTCLHIGDIGRFNDGQQFYAAANTVDESSFTQDTTTSTARTALQACVRCALDDANHFYSVLLVR